MNLLLMNLSHYIRRPMLILLQVLFMCITLPLIIISEKSTFWTPSLCGTALIGGIAYGYQMEILSKPFSFMLPDYRRTFRRLIFVIGAFWLILGAVLILLFWPRDLLHRVYGSLLVLGAGSLAFRLGTLWADKTRQPQALIGMMLPVIVFIPMLVDSAIVEKVLFNPFVIAGITSAGGIVTFRMWRNLGRLSLFQSYCGLQNIGVFPGFSQKRLQQARQQAFAAGVGAGAEDFLTGIETFFLRRIEHTRHSRIASYIYGAIYQALGPLLLLQLRSRWFGLFWMFVLFLFFGYYGKFGDYFIWFVFLMPMLGTDLQVHSTLLMTRGRTQRYLTAVFSLLYAAAGCIVIIFIFLGFMKIVEPLMPDIHLRGLNAQFHVLDWRMWYLFAAGVPLMAVLRLLFWGSMGMFLYSFVMMMAFFSFSFGTDLWHRQIPMGWIVLVTVGMWAVFAAYLYRVCFQKDLAVQR